MPDNDVTMERYVEYCDGPEGWGWYVLENREHPDGTETHGYAVGGPYESEGEADDYRRHLNATGGMP